MNQQDLYKSFVCNATQQIAHPKAGKLRWKLRHPLFLLLIVIMLLPMISFSPKSARENWADTNDYWTLNYNITEGVIYLKVLVYDNKYGPANEDGYVDNGHLEYSIDGGSNYTEFYDIDLDSKKGSDDATVINPSYNGPKNNADVSQSEIRDGEKTYWNFQLRINNNTRNISKIRLTNGHWQVNGGYGSDKIEGERSISVPKMSQISLKSYNGAYYNFVPAVENNLPVAMAQIGFVTSLNEVDRLSKVSIYNGTGVAASREYTLTLDPPPFLAHSSATDSNYYIKQTAYEGRFSSQTALVNVPAFTQPKSASATYNPATQTVDFTWTIDPVTTNNFLNDKFKLQVADNAAFTDAKDLSIDYDKTKSSYTYSVSTALFPHFYFRVARARTGFNWELEKRADVLVNFTSLSATKVKAVLQSDNTALLTWDPLNTAWLPGATLVITRINNSSKTQSEIKLNKAEFDKGAYTDQQIAICNSYNYTLQVVPPTISAFTAYAPIQIATAILPTEIGTLTSLDVSKGYFPDRTELRWSTKGAFDNFIVKRAVYPSTNYVQLTTVPGSTNSDYQTDDNKGTPGVYYTYQVVGVVKCNNTPVYSKETLTGIGFRSPTGNIYGRVTYENGQAVEDVSVRLQSNDQAQLGRSIYLNGTSGSFLKLDSITAPFSDSAFTVEAWIKPNVTNPVDQNIFQRRNQYVLGFDILGRLFFSFKGATAYGTYTNATNSFVHVAGIRTKDSLLLMLNNTVVGRIAVTYSPAQNVEKTVFIGRGLTGQFFKGYID
ncbi:MAG: LamG domain-containing protein, partial [Chitinophagaceae bacterium]